MKIDNQHEFNIADEYAKGQLYQAGKTAENYTFGFKLQWQLLSDG